LGYVVLATPDNYDLILHPGDAVYVVATIDWAEANLVNFTANALPKSANSLDGKPGGAPLPEPPALAPAPPLPAPPLPAPPPAAAKAFVEPVPEPEPEPEPPATVVVAAAEQPEA
jgi:outer membrane biosynthesis protein TonB